MRIHLGHHFYGAGNLGDDFMLAGFLAAMRTLAPDASFTCCVPFPLEPLQRRFPAIRWLPCDDASRSQSIAACDAWLGLGGSPFQSAQSRWFIDHLIGDAELCGRADKRMFYLGVGVQTATELAPPDVQQLCGRATAVWTRDAASADRLRALPQPPPTFAAADLAHLLFSATPPPSAAPGRVTLVANFDFNTWPGQDACLTAVRDLGAREHVWLAQESRELPGAERALFATLPSAEGARWTLVTPDEPGTPLTSALTRWPSGEWLITARFHAAIAGAWAGSKVVVVGTNEKLRGIARELQLPLIAPDADETTVTQALASARPVPRSLLESHAARAENACADFVRLAGLLRK